MAGATDRNGIFLVYDLGGGTFDAALVHAIDGEVTVLSHDGVNMLGGRDLDRRILEAVALPWLSRNFELPSDFAVSDLYRRLTRMARRSAEIAKIGLSTRDLVTLSASDEEIRLEDLRGNPIYLDVPLRRAEFETLAENLATRSIACCRNLLKSVGYRSDDVARVVLVGGPTKMPFLRRRIEGELGIEVEDVARVDPMTAVAAGAAIYCEGRDWSVQSNSSKASRARETAGSLVEVTYDYEARTAGELVRLTLTQASGPQGIEAQVDNLLGWSSGRRKVASSGLFELPLHDMGKNIFRVTIFGSNGLPIRDCGRDIVVDRLIATTSGVPATHHIAVKIQDHHGKDQLDIIVRKGDLLPATGVVRYRLTQEIRAGSGSGFSMELYQVNNEKVRLPELNLLVGSFQIKSDNLPTSAVLRRGDEVILHWAMREGQGITAEVELPGVGQRFDNTNFYNWQMAREDLSGEDGGLRAERQLALAERDLDRAEEAVPPSVAAPLFGLRERADAQRGLLRGSLDPEARRQAMEEVRLIRQEIALVCQHPDASLHLLQARLAEQRMFYDRDVRELAAPNQIEEWERVAGMVATALERRVTDQVVSDQIDRLISLYWSHGFVYGVFVAGEFERQRKSRHLAADVTQFDRFLAMGDVALRENDERKLREAFLGIISELRFDDPGMIEMRQAALMRA